MRKLSVDRADYETKTNVKKMKREPQTFMGISLVFIIDYGLKMV